MAHEHAHQAENHGEDWDGIYDAEQVWSGNPNDALVATLTGSLSSLPVGRAVDVGCGEGADAVWLARQGWAVTAVDVSQAALERGRKAAARARADIADRIEWVHSDIGDAKLSPQTFDLVSAFYPALRKDASFDAVDLLTSLVAPGGALLFVHHAEVDRAKALEHGFDPDNYVDADDLAATCGPAWEVERHETERHVTEGRGAHHSRDVVLVARRRA